MTVFFPESYHVDSINNSGAYQPLGPIHEIYLDIAPQPQFGNSIAYSSAPIAAEYDDYGFMISWGNPTQVQGWVSGGGWNPPLQPPQLKNLQVTRLDGQPDTCGDPPAKAWKDWPVEKRYAAANLLTDDDLNPILQSGKAGTLTAGQILPHGIWVPSEPNGPFTFQPPPYTIPEDYPNQIPIPTLSGLPSPTPSPSPTDGSGPPTASGGDSGPSPSPSQGSGEVTPEVLEKIANTVNSHKNYRCVECAAELESYLRQQNIAGRRIKLDIPQPIKENGDLIYDDSLDLPDNEAISLNGHHEGIAIIVNGEEMVFDNHHPNGVPTQEWENNLVFRGKLYRGVNFQESGYYF